MKLRLIFALEIIVPSLFVTLELNYTLPTINNSCILEYVKQVENGTLNMLTASCGQMLQNFAFKDKRSNSSFKTKYFLDGNDV